VRAYTGDISYWGQRIEIEDANVSGGPRTGNIKVAAIRIGGHIIKSAVPPDQLNLEYLVRTVVLGVGHTGT
jgi:hypothetical protein